MRFAAINGILWECACAPRIDSAYAMYVEVYIDCDAVATMHLIWMGGLQLLFNVVPGTDAEWLATQNGELTLGGDGRQSKRTYIATVAVVLRIDVLHLVVGEWHRIASNVL